MSEASIYKVIILVILFGSGYLLSILFRKAGIAESLVVKILEYSKNRLPLISLYLLLLSAFISFFISNTIVIMTMLPVLGSLYEQLKDSFQKRNRVATPLALAVISGANIGGMGSIIGSPGNAIFLTGLEIFQVPGRENINFFSWFRFSLITALGMLIFTWIIHFIILYPHRWKALDLDLHALKTKDCYRPRKRKAAIIFISTLVFWVIFSYFNNVYKQKEYLYIFALISVIFALFFLLLVFYFPFKKYDVRESFLKFKDIFGGIPLKGILFLIFVAIFGTAIYMLVVHFQLPEELKAFLQNSGLENSPPSPFVFFFMMAVITSLTSELVSNTAITLIMFPVAYLLAGLWGFNPLNAIWAVSLGSGWAFMSPVATPANALAYGSFPDISLKKMIFTGFFVNISGAFWIAVSMTYFAKY